MKRIVLLILVLLLPLNLMAETEGLINKIEKEIEEIEKILIKHREETLQAKSVFLKKSLEILKKVRKEIVEEIEKMEKEKEEEEIQKRIRKIKGKEEECRAYLFEIENLYERLKEEIIKIEKKERINKFLKEKPSLEFYVGGGVGFKKTEKNEGTISISSTGLCFRGGIIFPLIIKKMKGEIQLSVDEKKLLTFGVCYQFSPFLREETISFLNFFLKKGETFCEEIWTIKGFKITTISFQLDTIKNKWREKRRELGVEYEVEHKIEKNMGKWIIFFNFLF